MFGREVLAVVREHRADVAEHPGIEELANDVEPGEEERPERLHTEQSTAGGDFGDLGCLRGVQCEGFFDQDVFACLQRQPRPGKVGVVGGGDIHHVDRRVGDEVIVGAVRFRDAEPGREGRRAVGAPGGDRLDLLARVPLDRPDEALGDPAGPEHPPPQGGRGRRVRCPGRG